MQLVLAGVAALLFTVGGVFMKRADGHRNASATVLFLLFAVGAAVQLHTMRGAELGATYAVVVGFEAALAVALGRSSSPNR